MVKLKRIKMMLLFLIMVIFISLGWTILAEATGNITELEEKTEQLDEKLSSINTEILEITQELEELEDKIERTQSEILKTRDELVENKEKEIEQYESMKRRIRYMYEGGQSSLIEVLFSADGFKDFINKLEYVTSIADYDREMLGSLEDVSAKIKFEEENLVAQEKVLLVLQENSLVVQNSLEEKAKETQTDLASVKQEIEEVKEAQRIAAEKKAEEERLAAEKKAQEEAKRLEEEKLKQEEAQKAEEEHNNNQENESPTSGSVSTENRDLDVLAAILDCEARSDYNAMLAVATVIINRVSSSDFPNSISGVVYDRGQFSPTWTGKLDRVLTQGASSLAYRVAEDAIGGARHSEVNHCYYFLYAGSTDRNGINIGGNLFFTSW